MRNLMLLLALLSSLAVAGGISLDTARRFEFTNCEAGGSAAQTVAAGTYLLRVTTEDVWMCSADSASTCATGGDKLPAGMAMMLSVQRSGQSVSCRSALATGDLILTGASE